MNILIADHFSQTPDEPGNNRFTYLARMLTEQGHSVKIVTCDFSHKYKKTRNTDKALLEALPYEYVMLAEPGYKRNVSLTRFYSHYMFGRNLKKYLKSIEKPDLVYISVPSLDVGTVTAEYCRKNNIPLVVDIQDLWPEAFELVFNIPVLKNIIFLPMRLMADKTYRTARKIIAVSDTYMRRGLSVNKNDSDGLCVFLGTNLRDFDESAKSAEVEKNPDEFWVGYAGTLGHSYNIDVVTEALKKLKDKGYDNLVSKIMGDGPLMESFMKKAQSLGIRADFMGRMDYGKMTAVLTKCDIAVNPISKGAAQSIINKHGDYAAAALPVVSTQECAEYRRLIDEYGCGINCECEDAEGVAGAIERLYLDRELCARMGAASRRLAEERFDRINTYPKITEEIEKILNMRD